MKVDVLIVGAGLEGLAAGAVLAARGRRTLIVESAEKPGGRARLEEFHPGYRAPGVWLESPRLAPGALQALGWGARGVQPRSHAPQWVLADRDGRRGTPEELARQADESAGLERWRALNEQAGRLLSGLAAQRPPEVLPSSAKEMLSLAKALWPAARTSEAELLELLRIPSMAAADWLGEHLTDPLLRAGLCAGGLGLGVVGPRQPGTAAGVLLREAALGPHPQCGPRVLLEAALGVCADQGAELWCGRAVERIRVEDGRAAGVVLSDGARVDASWVLSTVDPKSTLGCLVPEAELDLRTRRAAQHFRTRGAVGVLRLALDAVPQGPEGALQRARLVGGIDELERAYDRLKYAALPGQLPDLGVDDRPWLEIGVPSAEDASLAPEGGAVLVAHVHALPLEPQGGWTEEARAAVVEDALDQLAGLVPGLRQSLVGQEFLAPPDLARRFALAGGHLGHGELALDQLWVLRPSLALSRHQTEIPGLLLAGAGTHPGPFCVLGSGLASAAIALAGRP